jgi:hypothetical protein
MAVEYRKNKNTTLFKNFEDGSLLNVQGGQNYIPIYERFFELNSTNWQNVTLSHLSTLDSILEKKNDNTYTALVSDNNEEKKEVTVFFKYSPLLDPNKYITGVYELHVDDVLPVWGNVPSTHSKLIDVNNASYVDSFFYYLSSRLKHKGFVHGLDFYGSYLGYKNDFKYILEDDAEFILNDPFFKKHHGSLFEANIDIPGKLQKLTFDEDCDVSLDVLGIEDVALIDSVEVQVFDDNATKDKDKDKDKDQEIVEYNISEEKMSLKSRSSSISSNSSNSSDGDETEDLDDTSGSNISEDSSFYDGEEPVVTIKKYPVQVIAIESCKHTLDSLLDTIQPEELTSCLCQVLMTLIAYQKTYQFTHNDLHTNNIMYVDTDEPFLYYFVEDTAYQVPTHGKIYKIIDFGRSIYTFQNKRFMSDSFSEQGDAATQYNTEPYMTPLKPRLEPNYSFDLCRLACSMIDTLPDRPEYEALNDLIEDWCIDDKGRNVVYKKNGEERYPGFKLYKMIARTVNKHIPLLQLRRPIFQNYIIKKKKLKSVKFIDLNTL